VKEEVRIGIPGSAYYEQSEGRSWGSSSWGSASGSKVYAEEVSMHTCQTQLHHMKLFKLRDRNRIWKAEIQGSCSEESLEFCPGLYLFGSSR
jgi:hypothetical protein